MGDVKGKEENNESHDEQKQSKTPDTPPLKKKRWRRPYSCEDVHDMLRQAGIKKPLSVNSCLKKGIQRGHWVIDGPDSLQKVLLNSACEGCGKELDITIRDVLYQSTYG